MSRTSFCNNKALPIIFFLFSTSLISQNEKVFASPDQVKHFKRSDPLQRFEYYNGVYDVKNKHYWASIAFTGVHGYAISGIWLLGGIGYGIFMIMKHQTLANLPIKNLLNRYDFLIFIIVLLFTFLAIIASSLVLLANQSALRKIRNLKETVLSVEEEAQRNIERIVKAMTQMQHLMVPYDPAMALLLGKTTHRIDYESRSLQFFVDENGRSIDRAIQALSVTHVVLVTSNLVLIIASVVLILLDWYPGFLSIICLCWILTSLCWFLTGFDFFLHTFAEDTCYAFLEFEQNPKRSSLGSMIPCKNGSDSDQMMTEVGYIVHNFINQLNSKIPEYYRILMRLDGGQNYEYISGFESLICNPFSGAPNYSYVPESCSKNAIPIGHLPNILASFTCYEEEKEKCKREGKLVSEAMYKMASAYSHSTQDLIDVIPDVQTLSECKFVNKFVYVVLHHCVPFCVTLHLLWFSMLSFSIVLLILVLLWLPKYLQGI